MSATQIGWERPNVFGHSFDPYTKTIDDTEGFGAFDALFKHYSLGRRILDMGGGSEDGNSAYVKERYDSSLVVYDPYMRSLEHNTYVLYEAVRRPFDACTSISVLNVISTAAARKDHIRLCANVLKEGGRAFFKVWPGDGTGKPSEMVGGYQSNAAITAYVDEVAAVFCARNVIFDSERNTLIGRKISLF